MAIIEFRGGPITHRYLMNKRRSDLVLLLDGLARDKRLARRDVADAIMLLTRRLPEDD